MFMNFFNNSNLPSQDDAVGPVMKDELQISDRDVINYLVELDDVAYDKLLKITNIYRKAEKQVADVIGDAQDTEQADGISDDMFLDLEMEQNSKK